MKVHTRLGSKLLTHSEGSTSSHNGSHGTHMQVQGRTVCPAGKGLLFGHLWLGCRWFVFARILLKYSGPLVGPLGRSLGHTGLVTSWQSLSKASIRVGSKESEFVVQCYIHGRGGGGRRAAGGCVREQRQGDVGMRQQLLFPKSSRQPSRNCCDG